MVIDSSALIAILLGEKEAGLFARSIMDDPRRHISSFSVLETSIVIEAKKGANGSRELDLLLYKIHANIVPFDSEQLELARKAWRKFGKGRHPASLNIGDCCSYALSKSIGEPLLYKGKDFEETDIGKA